MKLVFNYLNKPYPQAQNKWKSAISISLFISLFLYVFQPFGLQLLQHKHKSLVLLGYGLVTLMVLSFNMFMIPLIKPSVFEEEKWTIKKQIVWLVWIIFSISLLNYFYSIAFSVISWGGIYGLVMFLIFTVLIGVIPVVLITFIAQNSMLKKNMVLSQEINATIQEQKPDKEDHITIESGKQNQTFNAEHILLVESEGNYVNISCVENEVVKKYLIRNTIKNIETLLKDRKSFFKCHRAFIINLSYVQNVNGNSQGFNLELQHHDNTIPVSRTYTKDFKMRMIDLGKE